MPSLDGKVAIVTGAGRGIGREHALALARAGAKVVVNDLGGSLSGEGTDSTPAQSVVNEIVAAGGQAVASYDDVSNFDAAEHMIGRAIERYGRLDVLVNNAGILRDRMLVNMTEDEWDAVIAVHLKGHFAPTRHAASYWRERSKEGDEVRGRVINTSSPSGVFGNVGQANYGAAKAGIAGFTLIAAQELARYGVTVNCIAPNARTRMTEVTFGELPKPEEGVFDPLDASNMSPIVVALASDEAQGITGQCFFVWGGSVNVLRGWDAGELIAADEGWDPDDFLAQLLERFPEGAAPEGMLELMHKAGGRSIAKLAEKHLAVLAEQQLEQHGDHESLFFEGTWHTSGLLHERARRLATGLRDAGVEPGDRVVVLMANCPEVGIAYNALWRIGAVVTPAIFLLPPPELKHIVDDAEARVVLTTPEFADTAREAAPGARVISSDEFAELESGGESPITDLDDSELAALMYTGGTTGRAKGVMLSHENLWLAGKAAEDSGHVPGIVRSLTSLPLSHAFGLLVTCVGLHSTEPGRAVLMRWFNPEAWLELAQEHRTQIVAVVPSMLHLLLTQPLEEYDLSELRYIASGASPLAPEVVHELARRLPGAEVREGYGLTETSALVSTTRPGMGRLGSVGQPLPEVEVRILDDEDRDVPTGGVGEICVRSPLVMRGYWRAPEQTAEALRDGWLHTGDLGRLDEDGYLYVVDRKKDLIIRGGFNVFPRDVEEALLEHPAVEGAAVVGRRDPECGEEVVAFVALSDELDPAALVAWSRERIGGYKYPREVHVVGALPLTPVGKIDRKALRARLHEKVEA